LLSVYRRRNIAYLRFVTKEQAAAWAFSSRTTGLIIGATKARAGNILLADSTIFTTLFGGVESLETFWKNSVSMPLVSKVQPRSTQAVA